MAAPKFQESPFDRGRSLPELNLLLELDGTSVKHGLPTRCSLWRSVKFHKHELVLLVLQFAEMIKRWPPGLDTASSLYQGTKICRRRRRRTRLSVLNKAMCHFPDTVIMIEGRGCVLGLFNLWIKPVQA